MSSQKQLDVPPVPNLGTSGAAYSQEVQNQNNGTLRLFFIKLLNAVQALTARVGGKYINFPYGAFQDSTDQTAASTTGIFINGIYFGFNCNQSIVDLCMGNFLHYSLRWLFRQLCFSLLFNLNHQWKESTFSSSLAH